MPQTTVENEIAVPKAVSERAPLSPEHRRVMGVLSVIGTVLAGLIIFAMYPGGISPDGVFQVRQIRGEVPYNDWQPVSMT